MFPIKNIDLLIISLFLLSYTLSSNLTPLSYCTQGTLNFLSSSNFQNICSIEKDTNSIGPSYIFPLSLTKNYFTVNHCGICYEIVGNNGVIRGRVEDLYDDNNNNVNNIKASSDALNYIITNEQNNDISYRMVACDYNGNIKIKMGSNNNNALVSIVVLEHNMAIRDVKLMQYGNSAWNDMTRNDNNFWVYNNNNINLAFPLIINIYAINGDNVMIENIYSLDQNKIYEASRNFNVPDSSYFNIFTFNKIDITNDIKNNNKCCKLENNNEKNNEIIYQNGKLNSEKYNLTSEKTEITYTSDSTLKIKFSTETDTSNFIINSLTPINKEKYKSINFNMKYNQKCESACNLKFIINNKEENQININENNVGQIINYIYNFTNSDSEIKTLTFNFFYFSDNPFEIEFNDIELIYNNNNINSSGLCFNSPNDNNNNEESIPSDFIRINSIKIYDNESQVLNIQSNDFYLTNNKNIILRLTSLDKSTNINIDNCTTTQTTNINSFYCYLPNTIPDNTYNINSTSGKGINFYYNKTIEVKKGKIIIGNVNSLLIQHANTNYPPIVIIHSKEETITKKGKIIFDIYPISTSNYGGQLEEILFLDETSQKYLTLKYCEPYKVQNKTIFFIKCIVSNNILIGNYINLYTQNNNIYLLPGQSIRIISTESTGGVLTSNTITRNFYNFTRSQYKNMTLDFNILYYTQNLIKGDEFPHKVYLYGIKKTTSTRSLQSSSDYNAIINFKNCTLGDTSKEDINAIGSIKCLLPDYVQAGTYTKLESDGFDSVPGSQNLNIIFEKDYNRSVQSSNNIIYRDDDYDYDDDDDKTWIIWFILIILLIFLGALLIMLYFKQKERGKKANPANDSTYVKKSSEENSNKSQTSSN